MYEQSQVAKQSLILPIFVVDATAPFRNAQGDSKIVVVSLVILIHVLHGVTASPIGEKRQQYEGDSIVSKHGGNALGCKELVGKKRKIPIYFVFHFNVCKRSVKFLASYECSNYVKIGST